MYPSLFNAVPVITTLDGGVLEKNGSLAQVCVELESQIEMPFELLYRTEDGSATGICVHNVSALHTCVSMQLSVPV